MKKLPEIGHYDVEVFEQEGHIIETWSQNGVHHRIGGPAVTYYDKDTGKAVIQVYKQNGLVHRDNGPAHIQIHPTNDIVFIEEYYQQGELHRVGAPARIRNSIHDGDRMNSEYYLHNERVSSKGNKMDESNRPRFQM